MIQSFLEQLSFADKATEMFFAGDRNRRKEVEEKRITKDNDLAKGLKNMPAIWLDGVCKQLELSPERLRKHREMQIISYLGIEDNLRQVASRLPEEEKQMLKYLLKNGGSAKLSTIKRKYGSMDQDRYEWNRTCPKSVTGRLWSSALVFVGTDIREDSRKEKIVSVPIEFRDSLALLLH